MASLEEEGLALHGEECVVLHHRAGKVGAAGPCVVDPVEWALVPWDEALLPQDTTTTTRALRLASSHLTARATGAHPHSVLWQLAKLLRWTLALEHRL
jgi:hypothetical protein